MADVMKGSSVVAFGRKHKKCPTALVSCVCMLPKPVYFVCCGYWCENCCGYVRDGSRVH